MTAGAGRIVVCLFALVCAPLVATAQSGSFDAADGSPGATTIIERALEQARLQHEAAIERDFEYVTVATAESLDGGGKVTRTETTRRRHFPLEGHLYSELIERDGQPLDADDVRDERERKVRFVREARRHAARGEPYDPDEMRLDFDSELLERYDMALVGREWVRGDPCWVIRFEPRAGRLPESPAHRQGVEPLDRPSLDHAGRLPRGPGQLRDATSLPVVVGYCRHAASRHRPVRPAVDPARSVGACRFPDRVSPGRAVRHEVGTAAHPERVGRTAAGRHRSAVALRFEPATRTRELRPRVIRLR